MNILRRWLADIEEREESVYAPIVLTRETYQVLEHARKRAKHGAEIYFSLTYILIGGLGIMMGGLFANEVKTVLGGAILALSAFAGLVWIARGYKYKPGYPGALRPRIVVFDEAGETFPFREHQEKLNEDLKKSMGKV